MGYTKLNREHLTFNEGGRFFTLYWRWTEGYWTPCFFRIYLFGWSFSTLKESR